jgi:hypothetical protein
MESFGLLFRALVMLACLALVPFLCLYGKRLPDFAQAVMEAYKSHTHADSPANSQPAAGGEAPPFAGAARSDAPATLTNRGLKARPLDRRPGDKARVASQASFNVPVDGPKASGASEHGIGGTTSTTSGAANGSPDAQSSGQSPDVAVGASKDPSNSSDGCTVQFRRMEQRLRDLGATYYLLETWGTNGDRYRFFCKMSLAGNADYNRNRIFQATAADPMQAMQDVLSQVEQWRAGK